MEPQVGNIHRKSYGAEQEDAQGEDHNNRRLTTLASQAAASFAGVIVSHGFNSSLALCANQ
jgi:hypothetical protein